MKKLKMICLVLGLILLGGCSKTSTVTQKDKVIESFSQEEKVTETSESSQETEESSTAGDWGFKLAVKAAQSQIDSLKEQSGDMYTDISIEEGENKTIIYTYVLAQQAVVEVDSEALKEVLVEYIAPTINSVKKMFPDIKIQVIYKNPDGSDIANFTITVDDAARYESAA